jgi:hypothetical protein
MASGHVLVLSCVLGSISCYTRKRVRDYGVAFIMYINGNAMWKSTRCGVGRRSATMLQVQDAGERSV